MIKEMSSFGKPPEKGGKKIEKVSINWKGIKDFAKVAAFAFLINFPGMAQAQEQGQEDGEFKAKIENLKEKSSASEKIIFSKVKEEGKDHLLNYTPIKEWTSEDGSLVTVGYESDKREKESWIMKQSKDGSQCFYDYKGPEGEGPDGLIDRMIINNKEGGIGDKKMRNYMFAFQDIDALAKEAGVVSFIKGEDIRIFNVDSKNKELKVVDFNTGDYIGAQGTDSENYIVKVQQKFTDTMENTAKSIE